MATVDSLNAQAYETQHVHEVYEEIAHHFSSTRYKPWPIIVDFVKSLPAGSIGLDIGCGNGKNMGINDSVFIVGSDRSESLVKIAAQKEPHDVAVADILSLCHQGNRYDFAMSIAVVHHLSTRERRIEATRCILAVLRGRRATDSGRAGTALIYVWALEQKNSRRGWDVGCEQDVMVPWVTKQKKQTEEAEKVVKRYYHLYRKGELEEDILSAGGEIVESGYEKDNWWAIARRKTTDDHHV